MKARPGLGKGLEALIPQMGADPGEEVSQIRTDELRPNPYQPRRVFDPEKLQELMESIREHGVLQPIVVRRGAGRGYEIIAGERRFRAVQKLGLETIPALVRSISDKQAMEIALIENLQREDLNAIEIAEAYAKIMQHFSLTQEELSHRVGQSRSHVANLLRLLTLPGELREYVSRETLSMGHARALLALSDPVKQIALAKKAIDEDLSVRALESIVYGSPNVSRETEHRKSPEAKKPTTIPHAVRSYEEQFRDRLGTSVRIHSGAKRGRIEIEYYSMDDLERILSLITPQE